MKMMKWGVVLAVIGGAMVISTKIGQTLLKSIDQQVGLRSLETRITANLAELRDNRVKIQEQVFSLNTKAGQEEAKQRRFREERDRLDKACHRLAPKINEVEDSGGEIEWGMHSLARDDAIELLGRVGTSRRGVGQGVSRFRAEDGRVPQGRSAARPRQQTLCRLHCQARRKTPRSIGAT